jgi:cytidylate kinase
MKRKVICLTGQSAVGKSTIAKELGKELEIPIFSLGDYQREKFSSYGDPTNYHKQLGIEATYYGLWGEYLSKIESTISQRGIIIEGVYGKDLLEKIGKLLHKDQLYNIHITAPYQKRLDFFMLKGKTSDPKEAPGMIDALDQIKIKVGMLPLIASADITVTNDRTINDAVKNIADFVLALRRDPDA